MIFLLIWNARVLNEPQRARDAEILIDRHNVELVCLFETKVRKEHFTRILGRLNSGWCWLDNYNSNPSGRVILGWNWAKFKVFKLLESNQFIHTEVTRCDINIYFSVGGVC